MKELIGLLNELDLKEVENLAEEIKDCFLKGNKLFICGNGGSAAQSQHMAAELIGRFEIKNRKPLPAISLTVDTSNLTAIANDFGYDTVFLRQFQGLYKKGDLILGLSTSGNSENIIKLFEYAKKKEIKTLALLGRDGGEMKELTNDYIIVNNQKSCRIQEVHLFVIHEICRLLDNNFKLDKNE